VNSDIRSVDRASIRTQDYHTLVSSQYLEIVLNTKARLHRCKMASPIPKKDDIPAAGVIELHAT
jgi:hypothetical protein